MRVWRKAKCSSLSACVQPAKDNNRVTHPASLEAPRNARRYDAEKLKHQCGGGEGRGAGRVERRRDFDEIGAGDFQSGELTNELLRFPACDAADLRCARTGGDRRIEDVDVEGNVDRPLADNLSRFL